jgi:hypothetical protein
MRYSHREFGGYYAPDFADFEGSGFDCGGGYQK